MPDFPGQISDARWHPQPWPCAHASLIALYNKARDHPRNSISFSAASSGTLVLLQQTFLDAVPMTKEKMIAA